MAKKNKTVKKNTSNAKITIHQIYGIFDDGVPLKDIKVFNENVIKTRNYCKKQN